MLRLSLCLIVRDKADMLPGLLAAVDGLWDELIAADIGSQDTIPTLLAANGAKSIAVEEATGDWILTLDADERPGPALCEQIRALLDDETAGAATIHLRHHLPHDRVRESDAIRLWRRDPAIRLTGAADEDVASSVAAMLERRGLRLVNLQGSCDHLGPDPAGKERDIQSLAAAIADDPADWFCWYRLLELARLWNDESLWRDTAQQVAARLDGPPPADPGDAGWAGEMLALVAEGLFSDPGEQVAWLDRCEDRVPPAPAFYLRRGSAHEFLGHLDQAHRDFQRCRDLPAGASPMRATVDPLLGLCRLAAQRGDLLSAGDYVHQALAHAPRHPDALLAAVSFAWLNGGVEARDAFVAQHRELHGNSRELTLACADHALQSGLWDDALATLTGAPDQPPRGRAALMLAQARLATGEVVVARDVCRDLMADLPEASMGYLACCLVLGEEVEFSVDLEQRDADAALKTWIRVLWRSRQAPLMAAFIDHFPLVAGSFPWLPRYLTDQTERLKRRMR